MTIPTLACPHCFKTIKIHGVGLLPEPDRIMPLVRKLTTSVDREHGFVSHTTTTHQRSVLVTKDRHTRLALIALGWTPPKPAKKAKAK